MPRTLELLSLPDDLLARCFQDLSLLQRHQALPLTCRRLNRVVNAPQLLRTVEFNSTIGVDELHKENATSYLARAQSFACWAVRHAAGATQRLTVRIGASVRSADDPDAIWAEMLGVLAACGAGGSLREARLYVQFCTVSLPAWLPVALRGLRLLHLEVEEGILTVDVSFAAMAALEDLRLRATSGMSFEGLYLSQAASLPPTLRKLHIAGTMWSDEPPEELLPQVPGLPALSHLVLETCAFTPKGLEPLAQLANTLEALRIDFCYWLPAPATLARLTRLTFLDADNFIADREESLDDISRMLEDALAVLPQLRALRVSFANSGWHMSVSAIPRALTALQHLQHLVWDVVLVDDDALPPGSWLSGLLSLGLAGDVIQHNTAVLAAAQQLQHLVALRPGERIDRFLAPSSYAWHRDAVQWAAHHPTLRRLDIDVPPPRFPHLRPGPNFERANLAARLQNPNLQIRADHGVAATLEQVLERGGFLPA